MFGLIRFAISLVMLAAFVWFAVTVPLGKRTLWGHLHAIFATQEAKDLADGTKEEAERVARKVKEELHRTDMSSSDDAAEKKPTTSATREASASESAKAGKQRHGKVPLPAK